MKFQKGHKLAPGGYRKNAGRKSKQVIADRALAVKLAEERISRIFGDLIKVAEKVCKGIRRKRFYPKDHPTMASRVYYEIEYDTASLRFLIERFLPPAKQTLDVNVKSGFEKLIQDLEEEERREAEEQAAREKDETIH